MLGIYFLKVDESDFRSENNSMDYERNMESSLTSAAVLTLLNIFLKTIESGFILKVKRNHMKEWGYEKG